jgi:hypothetical protein
MFDYDLNEVYEFEEWHDLNRDEIMTALMEALREEYENA